MDSSGIRSVLFQSAVLGFLVGCDDGGGRDARPALDTAGAEAAIGSCGARPCKIAFRQVHRLGSFEGEDAIETPLKSVTGLPNGEVIIGSVTTTPYRFSAEGEYLGRVGHMGEGPGEFKSVSLVLSGPADSLVVFDGGLMRLTVFSPSLTPTRTSRLPLRDIGPGAAVLADGRIAVNGQAGGTRGGNSIFVLGPETQPSSFDAYPPWDGTREPADFTRLLAASADGGLWSADHLEYVLRKWSADGALTDSIRRTPPWFEGRSGYSWGLNNPGSRIQDLWEDADGYLWVVIWRARDTWREAWGDLAADRLTMREVRSQDRPRPIELFSTVIEILDPGTGQVLLSQAWPGLILTMLPHQRVAALTEDLYGVPYVDIWEYAVVSSLQER